MKRVQFASIFFAALAGLALAVGCGTGKKTVPTSAVAICGNATITKAQFDRLTQQAQKSYQQQKRPFPKAGSPEYNALRGQAMQFLVQRVEFDQKADDLGVKVSDSDVEKRLKQIKNQYFKNNEQKYRDQLEKQGLTEEQVRDDISAQLIQEGIYKKVTADVTVSEKDIADHYKTNRKQYVQPASRDVRHILVKKKVLADQLYRQLTAGADFGQLAKKYSLDTFSKKHGGKLTVSKGQTAKEFEKVAFSSAAHTINKPVKTQYGWHIIQPLSQVKKESSTPISQVKESIKQQLIQQKKQEKMSAWVKNLKKEFESKCSYQVGFAPPETTGTTATAPTPTK